MCGVHVAHYVWKFLVVKSQPVDHPVNIPTRTCSDKFSDYIKVHSACMLTQARSPSTSWLRLRLQYTIATHALHPHRSTVAELEHAHNRPEMENPNRHTHTQIHRQTEPTTNHKMVSDFVRTIITGGENNLWGKLAHRATNLKNWLVWILVVPTS